MNNRPRNPQPTNGTPYDIYLWPHSKTPELQALYEFLRELNWRFDVVYSQWHTPEDQTMHGLGRLEWDKDFAWARIQPPNKPGSDVREQPILKLRRAYLGPRPEWEVE